MCSNRYFDHVLRQFKLRDNRFFAFKKKQPKIKVLKPEPGSEIGAAGETTPVPIIRWNEWYDLF